MATHYPKIQVKISDQMNYILSHAEEHAMTTRAGFVKQAVTEHCRKILGKVLYDRLVRNSSDEQIKQRLMTDEQFEVYHGMADKPLTQPPSEAPIASGPTWEKDLEEWEDNRPESPQASQERFRREHDKRYDNVSETEDNA